MNFLRLFRTAPKTKYLFFNSARCMFRHPLKFTETQNRWRENDCVSQQYHLIYKGPLDNWLKVLTTYLTVTTTSLTCASAYYYAFNYDVKDFEKPLLLGDVVVANSALECLVYISALIGLHIAVKVIVSKYLVRLYQNGDNYIAIFRGHFYNTIVKHEFNRKDVLKLKTRFVTTWPDARYALGKKHAIILDMYFKTPEHFNYLVNQDTKAGDPNRLE